MIKLIHITQPHVSSHLRQSFFASAEAVYVCGFSLSLWPFLTLTLQLRFQRRTPVSRVARHLLSARSDSPIFEKNALTGRKDAKGHRLRQDELLDPLRHP